MVAAALLVAGLLIGAAGYYAASTYQTKVITTTETTTQTTVSLATTTRTMITTQISVSETTRTQVETLTQFSPTTTTLTSFAAFTSTTSIYPIPDNVTVYLVPSGMSMNYAIDAGSYSESGSLGNSQSFTVSPVFQGETLTINIGNPCSGSTGPTGGASLDVNGALVAHSSIACGGNNNAEISYIL